MKVSAILNVTYSHVLPFQATQKPSYSFIKPLGADTVSFTSKKREILSPEEADEYAKRFESSTSGYRGEYGKDFNDSFVNTMTYAASEYMKHHKNTFFPSAIIGGDTREATKKYTPEIRDMLTHQGIDVYYPNLQGAKGNEISPIASPVLAVAAKEMDVPLSVLMTASHNPWKDGGYNFIVGEGMVAESETTGEIADNIRAISRTGIPRQSSTGKGLDLSFDPYELYSDYLQDHNLIDFENIKNTDMDIYYEDFGGTGKYYLPRLMEDNDVEIKDILSSKTEGPNPTAENLVKLGEAVKQSDKPLRIGIATDGDSDRFGCVDENGNYIGANDVILLIAYHLIKNKGMREGTIIKNHSTSEKIDALARYFNEQEGCDIDVDSTPVGFKYLGSEMLRLEGTPQEAIVIGEESGGLTVRGHIPEKDGFVAVSNLLDLVATEKKPIGEILKEINSKLDGEYISLCTNMKFDTEEDKMRTVKHFAPYASGEEDEFAGYEIDKEKTLAHKAKIETMKKGGDGHKIYFKNNSSILVRKSGTEPIMRYYIDASSPEIYDNLLAELVSYAEGNGGSIKK